MNDNINKLYSSLQKEGFEDIGTEQQFRNYVGKPENVGVLYDALAKEGYEDIGSAEEFSKWLTSAAVESGKNQTMDLVTPKPRVDVSGPVSAQPEYKNPLTNTPEYNLESIRQSGAIEMVKGERDDKGRLQDAVTEKRASVVPELGQAIEAVEESKRKYRKEHPILSALSGFRGSMAPSVEGIHINDPKFRNLSAASQLLNESEKLLARQNDGSVIEGAKEAASDLNTYSMGLTEMLDNSSVLSAITKFEKGEELSPDEQHLLDAVAINMSAQAVAGDPGLGHVAGSAFVESIPFMVEMMMNPISGAGEGLGKAMTRYALKRFGKNAGKKAVEKAAKIAGRVAGDAMAATGMAATSGIAGVAADATARMTGTPVYTDDFGEVAFGDVARDEHGVIILDGNGKPVPVGSVDKESEGKAWYKAFASRSIENFSEMFGEYFGMAGKTLMNTKLGKRVSSSALMRAMDKFTTADWTKQFNQMLKEGRYNGFIGETAEEYVGGLLNAAFVGDQSFEDLASTDNLVQTVAAVGLMSGIFGSVNMAGIRLTRYKARKDLDKSEKKAYNLLGEDFDVLRDNLSSLAPDVQEDAIKAVLASPDLDKSQKEAVFDYFHKQSYYKGLKFGENKRIEEAVQAETDAVHVESNPGTGMYIAASRIDPLSGERIPGTIVQGTMDDDKDRVTWKGPDGNAEMILKSEIDPSTVRAEPIQDVIDASVEAVREIEQAKIDQDSRYSPDIPEPQLESTFTVNGKKYMFTQPTPEGWFLAQEVKEDGSLGAVTDEFDKTAYFDAKQAEIDAAEAIQEQLAQEQKPNVDQGLTEDLNVQQTAGDDYSRFVDTGEVSEKRVNDIASKIIRGEPLNPEEESMRVEAAQRVEDKQKEASNPINTSQITTENAIASPNEESNMSQNPSASEVSPADLPEQSTSVAIPADENGRLLYHLAPVEATLADILDGTLDSDEIDAFIEENKKAAGALLKKVNEKPPKMSTDKAKYLAQKKVWLDRVAEAEQQAAYWNEVESVLKESRMKPGDKAAEEIRSMGEPLTGEELAAMMLANGSIKLTKESYKKETGAGEEETKKMFGLFASVENGGVNIERAGELVMLADLENGTNHFDQEDPNAGRNAIIEVLSSARTRGDLINYVKNNRAAMAEGERQAEYNAYAEWCEGMFHMSPEDYEAYEEELRKQAEAVTDEAIEYVNGEIADEIQSIREEQSEIDAILAQNKKSNEKIERNDEGGTGGLREGSGRLLPEEQSVQAGRIGRTEEGSAAVDLSLNSEDGITQESASGKGRPLSGILDDVVGGVKPIGVGPFGPIYDQFRGKVKEAFDFLLDRKDGDLLGVFHRDDVGDIDLVWGEAKTKYTGKGLAHIIKKHIDTLHDFSSIDDAINTIDNVIKNGNIAYNGNNLEIGNNGYKVVIAQTDDKKWILTAFDNTKTKKEKLSSAITPGTPNGINGNRAVVPGDNLSRENKDNDISPENQTEKAKPFVSPERKEGENLLDYAERVTEARKLFEEEQKVDTNPSEAQKEAGNYKKGHIKVDGFDITIEQPAGSVRSGKDADGKEWSVVMNNTYGYIRGTKGVDGDHIDVFLGPNTDSDMVYVVDQVNPDGSFDEHKVMMGFNSLEDAKNAYLSNYEEGWPGLGDITGIPLAGFKEWVGSSHRKTKPFAEYRQIKKKKEFGESIQPLPEKSQAPTTTKNNDEIRFREVKAPLEEEVIIKQAKTNGTYMKAPNGKPTNLDERQWVQVRTKAFKDWFGDWETNPEEASKVVDENGEPKVVLHGTPHKFNTFDKEKQGSSNDYGWLGSGFYFYGNNQRYAELYAKGGDVKEVFLNVRSPYYATSSEMEMLAEANNRETSESFTEDVLGENCDGVSYDGDLNDEWVVYDPNQIKSATENIGEFSLYNDDIRFRVVHHGTGNSFDRFSTERIGTGEGMAAFGWGLYFTDQKEIAQYYAENIGDMPTYVLYKNNKPADMREELSRIIYNYDGDVKKAIRGIKKNAKMWKEEGDLEFAAALMKSVEQLQQEDPKAWMLKKERSRYIYDVDIPDSGYLNWDKTVPQEYKSRIQNQAEMENIAFDLEGDKISPEEYFSKVGKDLKGEQLYKCLTNTLGSDRNASLFLNRSGFNGIEYEAGRTFANKKGDEMNYVVFDDKAVRIINQLRYRPREGTPSIKEINAKFNNQLQEQIDGTLSKGHVYHFGRPSEVLLSAGIPDLPIELSSDRLAQKASKEYESGHPFSLGSIKNLPEALNNPIAIFDARKKNGAKVVLTTLTENGNNFLAAIQVRRSDESRKIDIEVNSIRSLYPKDRKNGILEWINLGLMKWVDKKKASDFFSTQWPNYIASGEMKSEASENLSKQRYDSADVSQLYEHATKIVENFQNPTPKQGEIVSEINDLSSKLHTPVTIITDVNEITDINEKTQLRKRSSKGWYNPKTKEIVIVLPNNTSVADAQRTFLHEAVAHSGLRKLFGNDFDTFLSNVYANANEGIRREILRRTEGNPLKLREATEEYLADLAERGFDNKEERSLWNRIKDAFIDMLRKIGVDLGFKLSDDDLRYILWRSYRNLKEGNLLDLAEDVSMRNKWGIGDYGIRYKREATDMEDDGTIEEYEERLRRTSFIAREAYQDSTLALRELQDILAKHSGKKIETWENADIAENQRSSKNTVEKESYRDNYFTPLLQQIANLIKRGETYQEIVNYMIAKHGLERNDVFARRDADAWLKSKMGELDKKKEKEKINESDYEKQATELKEKSDRIYDKNKEKDYSGLKGLMKDVTGEIGDYNEFANTLVYDFESRNDSSTLWEKANEATNRILKKSFESGLMSKGTYDHIKGMFKYYIPLRGWDETTASDVYSYINSERSPVNSVPRKARGRDSLADDPIATIANMAESVIMQGNRNLVKQNFLNMVINHPSSIATVKEMWYVFDVEDNCWKPSFPEIPPTATAEEVAMIIEEHGKRMKDLEEQNLARRNIKGLDVKYQILPDEASEHIVSVKRNGKEYVIFINGNPRAAQAVNGFTNPDAEDNIILSGISKLNRQLAANFTTRNPGFVGANLSRDLIFAMSAVAVKENSAYSSRFRSNVGKSMATVYRGIVKGKLDMSNEADRYFKEFLENGGETGYTALTNVDQYKKKIQKDLEGLTGNYTYTVGIKRTKNEEGEKVWAKKTFTSKTDYFKAIRYMADRFSDLNRWAEDISRFTTYMTSRQEGRGIVESVNDAKEVTVNFNRKGAGYKTMIKNKPWYSAANVLGASAGIFRNLFLFFNPGVQSLENFGKLAIRNKKGFGKLVGGFTVAGFLIPFLNQWLSSILGDDKDYYNDLSDWTRRNNMCIYAGGGRFVTIPLPIELRAFWGLGDLCYQHTVGKTGMTGEEIAYDAINQITELLPLNPLGNNGDYISTLMPDIMKPFWQLSQNEDFTGKPIYKENDFNQDSPEWSKAYKGTASWLVNLSEWTNELGGGDKYRTSDVSMLNWNPAKVEHLFEAYFGGLGKTFNQLGKTLWYGAESVLIGKKSDNLVARNVPVLNRFLKTVDEKSFFSKVNKQYYRYVKEYEEVDRVLKGYAKEVSSGNLEYLDKLISLQKSDAYKKLQIFQQYKSYIDVLENELDKISEKNENEYRKIQQLIIKAKSDMVEKLVR